MFSQGKELGSADYSSLPDVLDVTGQLFCSWGSMESSSSTFSAEEDQEMTGNLQGKTHLRFYQGKSSVLRSTLPPAML